MNVCIIIPLYNEEKRFKTEELISFSSNYNIDFFLINDGSTDDTEKLINKLVKNRTSLFAFRFAKNKGKAEAIRFGVIEALKNKSYSHIGYLDADFATPLNEINRLIKASIELDKQFVMGSRIKRLGAQIKRYKSRHFFGRIIATIISENILKLDVYDTQCGAKLISREIANEIFNKPFISKWLFDVELIARIKKQHGISFCLQSIYELPLKSWEDKGESKITFIDMLKVPIQLSKIYFHYR